jgi:hypothetical protein
MMAEIWNDDDDDDDFDKDEETFREDGNKCLVAKNDCEKEEEVIDEIYDLYSVYKRNLRNV